MDLPCPDEKEDTHDEEDEALRGEDGVDDHKLTFHVPMRRKTLMMSRMRLSAARMVLMIINSPSMSR